jgi:hypothetical protein
MEIKPGVDYEGHDGRSREVLRLGVSGRGTPLVVYRLAPATAGRPNRKQYRTECSCSAWCFMTLVKGAKT